MKALGKRTLTDRQNLEAAEAAVVRWTRRLKSARTRLRKAKASAKHYTVKIARVSVVAPNVRNVRTVINKNDPFGLPAAATSKPKALRHNPDLDAVFG